MLDEETELCLLLLGHVQEVALREERPPLLVADDQALVLDPDNGPVGADQAVVGAEGCTGVVAVVDKLEDALAIVGVQELREDLGIVDPLLGV